MSMRATSQPTRNRNLSHEACRWRSGPYGANPPCSLKLTLIPRTLAEYVPRLRRADDDIWRMRIVLHELGLRWEEAPVDSASSLTRSASTFSTAHDPTTET